MHTLFTVSLVLALLWAPPLGPPLEISQHFDLPGGQYQAGHRGVDMPASTSAQVYAPTSGTVTFVGTVVDRPVISIRVDAATVLSLEPVDSELKPGDQVVRGQEIGQVAAGGHCASSCLHLGVRVNDQYVNPLLHLLRRAVLLPW